MVLLVRNAYDLPTKGRFDTIILFIGGNDLYFFTEPTKIPVCQVANQIVELANFLCELAQTVYVFGIPERGRKQSSFEASK